LEVFEIVTAVGNAYLDGVLGVSKFAFGDSESGLGSDTNGVWIRRGILHVGNGGSLLSIGLDLSSHSGKGFSGHGSSHDNSDNE
jgi:hypothetical protein